MQLGFYRQAMVGIRASGDTRILADRLAALPEVDYVVHTAGSFDVLAEVVCENDEELIALLNSRIRSLDGVLSTETFVYLKLHKQFYNWGTR
jgi:Lrp/AsnC family transcriptional regulator for asnA, asnC and gidA